MALAVEDGKMRGFSLPLGDFSGGFWRFLTLAMLGFGGNGGRFGDFESSGTGDASPRLKYSGLSMISTCKKKQDVFFNLNLDESFPILCKI